MIWYLINIIHRISKLYFFTISEEILDDALVHEWSWYGSVMFVWNKLFNIVTHIKSVVFLFEKRKQVRFLKLPTGEHNAGLKLRIWISIRISKSYLHTVLVSKNLSYIKQSDNDKFIKLTTCWTPSIQMLMLTSVGHVGFGALE